MTFML